MHALASCDSPTQVLELNDDQYYLLASLVEFALDRYEDNKFPLVEGYIARLKELRALVTEAKPR